LSVLRHGTSVNKVKTLPVDPENPKRLNNGYEGVSVALVTGLCNSGVYFQTREIKTPPHPALKRKKKIRQFLVIVILSI